MPKQKRLFGVTRNGEHLKLYNTRDEANQRIAEEKQFDIKVFNDGWVYQYKTLAEYQRDIHYHIELVTKRHATLGW